MKIKTLADKLIWVAIIIYATFFSYLSILKYQNFIYNDFDIAIDAQTLWNITHGSFYSSIHQIVFLGNHMRVILFLVAPFYAIFKSPIFLLVLQSVSLGLAAYPLYKIAKDILNPTFALAISFSYFLYPALGYMNLFEFHPVTLATCFLMFMGYYFYKNLFSGFIISAVLALLCQENISLLLISVGIFSLFARKGLRWVVIPIIVGAVYFYVAVFKIMPYFNKGTVELGSLYSHLGGNLQQVILTILLNPLKIFLQLILPQNLSFLFQLFSPLMFLSLFCMPILAVALPIFAQHMLSSRIMEKDIFYHYSAELIPFIFVSAVYGIKRLFEILKEPVERRALLWALILVPIVLSFHLGVLPDISKKLTTSHMPKDFIQIKQQFVESIPQDASVAATFAFLPKLSNRKYLYSFHHFYKGFSTLSSKQYKLPENIDYALIDFNDAYTFEDFYSENALKNIKDFIRRYDLGILSFVNEIALYKKGIKDNIKLFDVLAQLPKPKSLLSIRVDEDLYLKGYDLEEISTGLFQITFYWRCIKAPRVDYGGLIYVEDDKNSSLISNFIVGSRIYPTSIWDRERFFKDVHRFILPKYYKRNDCKISLMLLNSKSRKLVKIYSSKPEHLTEKGYIKILLK